VDPTREGPRVGRVSGNHTRSFLHSSEVGQSPGCQGAREAGGFPVHGGAAPARQGGPAGGHLSSNARDDAGADPVTRGRRAPLSPAWPADWPRRRDSSAAAPHGTARIRLIRQRGCDARPPRLSKWPVASGPGGRHPLHHQANHRRQLGVLEADVGGGTERFRPEDVDEPPNILDHVPCWERQSVRMRLRQRQGSRHRWS
jgi:hypothetical protein